VQARGQHILPLSNPEEINFKAKGHWGEKNRNPKPPPRFSWGQKKAVMGSTMRGW